DSDALEQSVRRRFLPQHLRATWIGLRRMGGVSMVGEDSRLFLASDAADRVDGAGRLRHHDAFDQKFVPGRIAQAICSDRARQGLLGNPGAVRTYLPQRDAPGHRRVSGRLRERLLRRLAVDRDDLLARRARVAQLRERAQPRLSGGVRQSLHLRACRTRCESDLRPDLYLDRPAHRFRNAGGVSWTLRPLLTRSRSLAEARSRRQPSSRTLNPPARLAW